MDLQIFDILPLISLFFLMILALKLGRNLTKTKPTPKTPPGPWKLPIIGNIPHVVTPTPHRKLRDLAKKYGPLMHLQLGEVFTVVVSSAECAKEVMKTHDLLFASRYLILALKIIGYDATNISFSPYGNYWRQLRKICISELFTPKRLSSFKPIREEVLSSLIKMIKEQEEYISVQKEVLKVAGGFDVGDLFPSATWLQNITGLRPTLERLHRKSDQIHENIMREHKDKRSKTKEGLVEAEEDLVDVLLKFQNNSGENQDICLTDDNIKAIIDNIFAAGGETTATTIDWAMAEMIRNPRVMKRAQAEVREVFKMNGRVDETCINEMKYLKLVIKETLRLHPPAPLLLPRECGQTCEIDGYHIPVKSKVIVNAWAIGRDPNYWSDPERFYPERFIDSCVDYKGNDFEFIPFGAGRRICPGITFGLMNVELTLALLLYHFDWKLPNGMKAEELDMTEQFGLTVRRKNGLFLIPSIATQ
ncbi:Cytochrome P450 [Vigna angularis]|uniref:Cytochrome P450 n=1 Tax=Phaseolus angularis TaxID=3914 RepID=A0A8T0JRM2_PHAAN|nr:Cytochrome P450 [Vigna angularis]